MAHSMNIPPAFWCWSRLCLAKCYKVRDEGLICWGSASVSLGFSNVGTLEAPGLVWLRMSFGHWRDLTYRAKSYWTIGNHPQCQKSTVIHWFLQFHIFLEQLIDINKCVLEIRNRYAEVLWEKNSDEAH